jgi:hypothetical protein
MITRIGGHVYRNTHQAVWQVNIQVYRADKVWHQMSRECTKVERCTVERQIKRMGLHGVCRGAVVRTTAEWIASCLAMTRGLVP